MRRVGVAFHGVLLGPDADGRAVAAPRRGRIGPVNLLDGRVIRIGAEGLFHRPTIGVVGICRDLDALRGDPAAQVIGDGQGGLAAAVPDEVAHHELGIGIERRPRPHVASAFRGGLGGCDVLRLGITERPDFIDLDPLRPHAHDQLVMEGQAGLASVHKQLGHSVDRDIRHTADRAHGRTLAEHREDLDALGEGQLVHAPFI